MSKILVTDGGYSHSLSIIRSLTSLGHIVDCIGRPLCLSSFSLYVNRCTYNQSQFKPQYIDKFLSFLETEKYDFLIPIGADSVSLVNRFRKEIVKRVRINIAPEESIKICLEKDKLLLIAEELGIPTPKRYKLNELKETIDYGLNIKNKLVIKPSSELSNDKVIYTKDIGIINSYLQNEDNYLVQDYVSGYGVGFFAVYDNGNLRNFFMHKRIRENPPSGGSSVCAASIFDQRLYDYGKKLLDKLNWHGVAMVEFKKTHATNELYLMEVNPKFWASHDLAIESGLNFAEKYLEIEENKPLTKKLNMELTYKIDKKFQWLARDLSSSLLKPLRFLRVIYTFLSFKAHNNLHLKDPFCSLYLIIYAFFSPLVKTKFINAIYTFFSRIKNYGFNIAFIRTFSECTGIPILKYSNISKNIAIGSAPSKLGLLLLRKSGFKYILNLRFEERNKKSKYKYFKALNLPIKEFNSPTILQLDEGSKFINQAVLNNKKIFVHCREGVSRAPCLLIAYFMKYHKLSFKEALHKILIKRNFINILPDQKKTLLIYKAFLEQ